MRKIRLDFEDHFAFPALSHLDVIVQKRIERRLEQVQWNLFGELEISTQQRGQERVPSESMECFKVVDTDRKVGIQAGEQRPEIEKAIVQSDDSGRGVVRSDHVDPVEGEDCFRHVEVCQKGICARNRLL